MPEDDENFDDEDFDFEDGEEENGDESESDGFTEAETDGEGGLVCEECNTERATVHITDLSGEKPVQKHLCKTCAQNLKEYAAVDETEVYAQLLGQIMPELKELSMKVCPSCKISYLMFRHGGRLGCDKCYEAFDPVIETMIERIHGAKQHVGKIPPTVDQDVALESRIRTLEQLMQEAAAREEYERAGRLRDEIRAMKDRMGDET